MPKREPWRSCWTFGLVRSTGIDTKGFKLTRFGFDGRKKRKQNQQYRYELPRIVLGLVFLGLRKSPLIQFPVVLMRLFVSIVGDTCFASLLYSVVSRKITRSIIVKYVFRLRVVFRLRFERALLAQRFHYAFV